MITRSGRAVYHDAGQPSLSDIAWGLSRTCRFAGQTEKWYCVLAHTFTVAAIVPEQYRLHALLHDAAESIVGDQVTSWKNSSTAHDERTLIGRICYEHGIDNISTDPHAVRAVKQADKIALSAEAMVLGHAEWNHGDFLVDFESWQYERAFQLTEEHVAFGALEWINGKFVDGYIEVVQSEVEKCMVS